MKHGIKARDFMALSKESQAIWIEENIKDYDLKLHGAGYIGCFYPDNIVWEDYLRYPKDYGVSGLIASQYPAITDKRIEEIDSGAELTTKEKEHLLAAVAAADVDNWITHNSFEVKMLGNSVFVYFHGHSIGQGDFNFEYQKAFLTYEALLIEISSMPLSYID